jgi:hypothetical protein
MQDANDKNSITEILNESVVKFNALIQGLDKTEFETNYNMKWSAGQDLLHLVKLLRILNIAYLIPKGLLVILYGKNKRETRSFETLQTMYKKALAGDAQSPNLYIPKPVLFEQKSELILKHSALNKKFVEKINKLSEEELDKYLLPHPILGKVSLRELAIFTCFHTIHHYDLLKSKLNK